MAEVLIKGRGKGGGGSGGSEAENTLKSRAIARIIDAVSEGEVEGLVDGEKSIYMDGVPLKNADGSYNFTGVKMKSLPGTQSQPYLEDFPAVENEVAVGIEVKKDTPVVRSINNSLVNAVVVKIGVPQLMSADKNGNMNGTDVQLAIDLQPSGAGWTEILQDKINGKCMSRYERAYRIKLTGTGPWNIRVRRLTADSASSKLVNAINWSSFTEVIDAKLTYPNTALVALEIDSAQFSGIPARGYDMKLLKVRVPENFDPVTRTYAGPWDGASWKIAWTDCPAWCLYDLLTSERYGVGEFVDQDAVDKWALYEISKYCAEQIPNGFGGFEPRFSLNCYIQTRQSAYRLINDLCSVFRGMSYWSAGSVTATCDSPSDPVAIFTNANVVDGRFSYSGSSIKARHTVALVTWSDQSEQGKDKIEYVEDVEGIAKYGVVQTEVTAFGCTSRAQAHRVGKWMLLSEREEVEVASFKSSLDGSGLRPGDVVKVRDNMRYANRLGGRVISATPTVVTLDAPVTMTAGATYELSVMLPTGEMVTKTVSSGAGTFDSLTLSSALTAAPQSGSIWVLQQTSLAETKLYRVVSVTEVDGINYEVTALLHDASKFAKIDGAMTLDDYVPGTAPSGSGGSLNDFVAAPTGLKNTVTEWDDLGTPRTKVSLSWNHVDGLAGWDLEYTVGKDNPVTVTGLGQALYEIPSAEDGHYAWRVRAAALDSRKSLWTTAAPFFIGADTLKTITSLQAFPGFLSIRLRWGYPGYRAHVTGVEIWCATWLHGNPTKPGRDQAVKIFSSTSLVDGFVHVDLDPRDQYVYWVRLAMTGDTFGDMYPTDGLVSAPKADVTEALNALDASFRASQFYADLTSRIDNIDAPSIDSLLEQLGITKLEDAIDQLDSLLLQQVIRDERIMNGSENSIAALQQSYQSIATDLGSEVTLREALLARFDNVSQNGVPTGKTMEAFLLEQKQARADGDSANAALVSAVTARLNNSASSGKTIEAVILDNKNAQVAADSALTNQINTVSARLDNGGDVYNSLVQVETTASAKSATFKQATPPTATKADDLWIDTANGNSLKVWNGSAWVPSDNTTIGTSASQITSLQSRLNNVSGSGVNLESALSTSASDITGLKGQYTLKIDVNGRVSGIGLAAEAPIDDSPSSTFAVIADRFVIAPVGTSPSSGSPFFYLTAPTTIDGVLYPTGAYLKSAFIADATIGTLKLGPNSVTVQAQQQTATGTASATITLPQGGWVYVTGQTYAQGGSGMANLLGQITGAGQQSMTLGQHLVSDSWGAADGSVIVSAIFNVGAGTHTFTMNGWFPAGQGTRSNLYTNVAVFASQR